MCLKGARALFGLFVFRVLLTERTVFVHNESVGIVLLVFNTVVVSMLAFRAFKRNFRSSGFNCHNKNSIQKITPLIGCVKLVYHTFEGLSIFFESFFYFFCVFIKLFFFSKKKGGLSVRAPVLETFFPFAHAYATV